MCTCKVSVAVSGIVTPVTYGSWFYYVNIHCGIFSKAQRLQESATHAISVCSIFLCPKNERYDCQWLGFFDLHTSQLLMHAIAHGGRAVGLRETNPSPRQEIEPASVLRQVSQSHLLHTKPSAPLFVDITVYL